MTMDCAEAARVLYDYLDGELDARGAAAVRRHLRDCQECFRYFQFEQNYLRFLQIRTRSQGAPQPLKRCLMEQLLRDDEE